MRLIAIFCLLILGSCCLPPRGATYTLTDLGDLEGGDDESRAFLWQEGCGMVDLNDQLESSGEGWTLLDARDINNAGQIVGHGVGPTGKTHAILLSPRGPVHE